MVADCKIFFSILTCLCLKICKGHSGDWQSAQENGVSQILAPIAWVQCCQVLCFKIPLNMFQILIILFWTQMHSFPSRRKRRSPVANRQPLRTCNYSSTAASLLQTLQETKIQVTDVQQMKNWNKHNSGDLISFTCHMYGSKEDDMTACCGLWSAGHGKGKKNLSEARSTESQKAENKWW